MIRIIKANKKREYEFIKEIRSRAEETDKQIEAEVRDILTAVKTFGDMAVLEFSKRFDNAREIKTFTKEDFAKAYEQVPKKLKSALQTATNMITEFHKKQLTKGFKIAKNGYELGQTVRGLERVVVYAPCGTAGYFSSVLMAVIPAKIAGVKDIVIMSPPPKNGEVNQYILASAHIAGADSMVLVGGAHGIGAFAYGTESIPRADKIVGPGNAYVATAKKLVYGAVGVDMIAGPSDITIIADESANPKFVASDLLSQAEHDKLSSAILLTTSQTLAEKVKAELEARALNEKRLEYIKPAIENYSGIIVCKSENQCVELANLIAPEHLEILTVKPRAIFKKIKNAGSVFLGEYSTEPLGDYIAGLNHTLPTSGTARFCSALSVDDFVKKIQYMEFNREAFNELAEKASYMAECEGLFAHAEAIRVRGVRE
ncbi:MAG: histidinol dehydrogenase [Firmicutes bacterium]|nr:histidinol dehydrogenase [Bacillota bacterium]